MNADRVYYQKLFFLFLNQTYVVGTQKNHLNKTVLLSTQIMFNPFHSGYLPTGTLTNSEDPDEMPHNVAFHHQGLHCLQR